MALLQQGTVPMSMARITTEDHVDIPGPPQVAPGAMLASESCPHPLPAAVLWRAALHLT